MSIPLTINGVTYDYPEVDDVDWGPEATDWAAAVTNGMLQKAGGLFQLLAEVDFGTAFGVKSLYFKTRTANPASAGQFRLARADVIAWRNQANSSDLNLGVSASDVLQFNGVDIQNAISVSDTSTIDLTLSGTTLSADIIAGSITNTQISNAAAIAYSKLALTGSIVNADLANMAQSTIKGRAAGAGAGAPVDLTATQATAILNDFVGDSGSGGTKGLVPAPAAGDAAANKFLKANGQWITPVGAGDVVGPASSLDNAVARFDGTTGKLLQSSSVFIDDSWGMTGLGNLGVGGDLFVTGATTLANSLSGVVKAAAGVISASAIVNADVDAAAAISYSKLALTGNIVNADIGASAAIAYSKLAALTASRALVSDGSGFVAAATTTATEIGYVNGVTSSIQTQLDGKAPNTLPTQQKFTSGSGTYNLPAGCRWIRVRMIGGGASGGGGGVSTSAGSGSNGNDTTFGTLTAGGGTGGPQGGPGGAGGANTFAGTGFAIPGGSGSGDGAFLGGGINAGCGGGVGGNGFFGGAGGAGGSNGGSGQNGATNSGGGGGGGGCGSSGASQMRGGAGGGSGGYIEATITSPSSTYSYGVGAAQTSVGSAGTAGGPGGQGAAGIIIVDEYY